MPKHQLVLPQRIGENCGDTLQPAPFKTKLVLQLSGSSDLYLLKLVLYKKLISSYKFLGLRFKHQLGE